MSCCGLWATPRRLVAVLVNDRGKAATPISVPRNDDARWGLLVSLPATPQPQIVLTDELAARDTIGEIALRLGIRLWFAPAPVVDAVRHLAGLTKRHPKLSAALLARWPEVPALRGYLRLADPAPQRQMNLWSASS